MSTLSRPAASGFTKGQPSSLRKDVGEGDIPPEVRGRISSLTNPITCLSATAAGVGQIHQRRSGIGFERQVRRRDVDAGSPQVEESAYWFNLLIDTPLPICGNSAQRPHGQISNDGPRTSSIP